VAVANAPSAAAAEPKLKREVGMVGLLFVAVGSIIGSGWLFGALSASQIAGPAVMIAWVIGGAAMLLLALVHAELGGMFAVAGGSARFPHIAFGSLSGFAGGWFAFLGAVTTAPIEVEAAIQYSSNYLSGLTTTSGGTPVLTFEGFIVAGVLMLIFSIINVMGVKWLSESNKVVVWWKLAIPVLTVIVLLVSAIHTSNFSAGGGFMPFGWKGIFLAIPGAVIFSYLGFEQAIQLGGESKNPKRNIPLAVIGSMVIGVVLYIALQVAYIVALDPSSLSKGWDQVTFGGHGAVFGPFAGLATALGVGWLATLLYIDAIVSPFGTGLLYVGTSARLTFGMGRDRYVPRQFAGLTNRGVPLFAIAFSFLLGMIVFLPFPGWQQLVGFISSATVLAYSMAPLALGALRKQEPDRPRPFKLPAGGVLSPIAFAVAGIVILFAGFAVVWKLIVAIALGFILLAISALTSAPENRPKLDWWGGLWLWPYILGMGVISYFSSFSTGTPSKIPLIGLNGPVNDLHFGVDVAVTFVFSLLIYALAMKVRLLPEQTHRYAEQAMGEAESFEGEDDGLQDEPSEATA
jgi:amino acid transporter